MKTDNEIIAEFLGYQRSNAPWEKGEYAYTLKLPVAFNKWVIPSHMLFATSWDWLMPVVEKIRKDVLKKLQATRPPNSACKGDLIDVDISCGFMEVDIAMVYKHVVEFIKWYNENLKSSN